MDFWRWQFFHFQNPQHTYPAGDADYTVKLKITDISGCPDSVTKTNYIKIRMPKAAFDIRDTTTICPPLRTGFIFQGSDYAIMHWDFGDGGTSLAKSNPLLWQLGDFIPTLNLQGRAVVQILPVQLYQYPMPASQLSIMAR